MTDDELDALALRFAAGDVPRSEWTHEAHLRMGAWHVAQFGAGPALALLRERITRLNHRNGVANTTTSGYHETVTAAYVRIINAHLAACAPETSLADRVRLLLASPLARRDLLLDCYSRERLMSPEARVGWVEPDLAPLPTASYSRRGQ
ncbi:MAG: hypothetical protein ACJ8F1_03825 [Polyangia bacterium]